MPSFLKQVVVAVICSGLVGCQSAPRWDWWRLGSSRAPDSSPIARSAGPSLPSELAQQGDSDQLAGNMQLPTIDSGGEAPAYEQDTARFARGTSGLAGSYSAMQSGPAGMDAASAGGTLGSSSPTNVNVAGDPFARSPARDAATPGVGVQNGPYGSGGYAASPSAPASALPMAAEGNRYGHGGSPSQYGSSSLAISGTPQESAAPWSGGSSRPSEGIAAAGYQQPSSTPPASAGGNSNDYPTTPTYPSTSPTQIAVSPQDYSGSSGIMGTHGNGGEGRYGGTGTDGSRFGADTAAGIAAAPAQATPSYSPAATQTAQSSALQPYRPGGTSDYTGPGSSAPISIAGRQPPEDAASNSTMPSAPPSALDSRYSTPQSEFGSSGTGRRY